MKSKLKNKILSLIIFCIISVVYVSSVFATNFFVASGTGGEIIGQGLDVGTMKTASQNKLIEYAAKLIAAKNNAVNISETDDAVYMFPMANGDSLELEIYDTEVGTWFRKSFPDLFYPVDSSTDLRRNK